MKKQKWLLSLIFSLVSLSVFAHYDLNNDPIDVIIPCCEKDLETLPLCIKGAKENIHNVRRIIVVSSEKYTDDAEWFDESKYPFSKLDVAMNLIQDEKAARAYYEKNRKLGWYFQQLLKLYGPIVIPNISSNVLVLDSDTVFLRPVAFLNDENGGMYCPATEYHIPYFIHMEKLMGLNKVFPQHSGIAHHMLFQKSVLVDLLNTIEQHHGVEAWKAFCRCVDPSRIYRSGASEYEIYFNFVFTMTDKVSIRPLKFKNIHRITNIPLRKTEGYDFVSYHHHNRNRI